MLNIIAKLIFCKGRNKADCDTFNSEPFFQVSDKIWDKKTARTMRIRCNILAASAAAFAVVASSHPGGDDAIGNESLTIVDKENILSQENKYRSFAEIVVICYIKHYFFGGKGAFRIETPPQRWGT